MERFLSLVVSHWALLACLTLVGIIGRSKVFSVYFDKNSTCLSDFVNLQNHVYCQTHTYSCRSIIVKHRSKVMGKWRGVTKAGGSVRGGGRSVYNEVT